MMAYHLSSTLSSMILSSQQTAQRGFGLNQLLVAIVVIGIISHYASPAIKRMTNTAESKASDTKTEVTDIFGRRF